MPAAVRISPPCIFGATLFIAALGFADDIKPVPVLPRLLLQAIAVGAIVLAGTGDLRIAPLLPLWIERGLLVLAGLWFVNLVNFMDGLDWMTAAEVVPITAAMALLGLVGEPSMHGRDRRCRALRRDDRFCAVQPSGRDDLSRRCRQPADRPVARLVSAATGLAASPRRRVAVAALLSGRCHAHAAAPADARRAVLGRAPLPFLSARHRQRLYACSRWCAKCSRSISRWRRWPQSRSRLRSPAADAALLALGAAAVAFVLFRFSRPRSRSATRFKPRSIRIPAPRLSGSS